jgi:rRNA-processing protein FCF1
MVAYVTSADAAIVERASKLRRDRVVITSDRAVREEAERVGAIGLWSSALCRWLRPG